MINQAYSLLRNLPGTVVSSPGGEYVDPTYQPAALPQALQAVRAILFGSNPDAVALNTRLRQYLTILHCGPYVEHLTDLDNRVSYWPFTAAEPIPFGLSVTPIGSAGDVFVSGQGPQEADSGITTYSWTLTVE